MKLKVLMLMFLLSLPAAAYTQSQKSDLYTVKVKKVKDGIYLAYRPDPLRPFVEGNVTIIINEHDVVLVDAGGAPTSARNVIAEIKKLTPHPISYIIYTHIHRDHRFGTQEYLKAYPGVEIISHPADREIIAGSGQKFVADTIKRVEAQKQEGGAEIRRLREERRPGYDQVIAGLRRFYDQDINTMLEEYRGVINVPPTMTFERRLRLHRGSRTIDIEYLGKGDTPYDLIVYLPNDRLVCAGDMVVHPIPYAFSEDPVEWLVTLGKVSELNFDTLIPGHGEVQQGKVYLQKLMSLLRSVQTQVRAGVTAGLDLEGVRTQIDVSGFEKDFAGDNPVYRYYFREYTSDPLIERTFKRLKAGASQ
jgi:glyoxylase-like metal-dependent hydrolase (beta-lactamase superfamily II)